MDEKDLEQRNGEKKDFDENIKPFLEGKDSSRKKAGSGRLVLGILLIIVGGLMGLAYMGSFVFVNSVSSRATSTTTVEYISAPAAAVAVQEVPAVYEPAIAENIEVVYECEQEVPAIYAPTIAENIEFVYEDEFRETSNNGNTIIEIGDIYGIDVTVLDADTTIKVGDSSESRVIIKNNDFENINYSINDNILRISELNGKSNTKISIELPYTQFIKVNSNSGDLKILGDKSTTLDSISFTTNSGDCEVDSINAANAIFQSSSGDLEINNSFMDSLNSNSSSGDVEIYNIGANNLSVITSSGDVEVAEWVCDGNAEIRTTSGNISLGKIIAQTLSTHSSSGWLELSDSQIELLSTSSSSGRKNISNSYCREVYTTASSGNFIAEKITSQVLNISSSSGRADVQLIPLEDIQVDIMTSSGNVELQIANDIAVALRCDKVSKNELRINTESNNRVNIQTNSGTVKLTK